MMNIPQDSQSQPPHWRFPPNEGGAEQGTNPGQKHFSADAFTNMVREVLQNSLDHHQPGLDGVQVTFKTLSIQGTNIQTSQLLEHVRASLHEAEAGQNPDTTRHYQEMEDILSRNRIPCLAIVDENTTGLQGENWKNLIFREGMPQNTGEVTKGGSIGLGKHASFNLSACNTVIYSTRYVDKAARGRVCHMAGRSQLITHEDSSGSQRRLRDVGFLGKHQEGYNEPISGPDIPEAFELKNSGTGVFIIGFRREKFPNWTKMTTQEVLRNFFYAIHTGRLEVCLQDQEGGAQSTINQKSLDTDMEQLGEKDSSRQYFQAIREEPLETNPSEKLGPSRRMRVWISTDRNAPKRLAHLNRRGMLITDAGRIRENPLMPYGGGSWTPWCAVTMAADEETDRFLRRMEPATHNAIHPGELQDPTEQDDATQELKHHREQIAELIRSQIEQTSTTKSSNITELAELFPNLQIDQGTDMEWREIESQQEKNRAEELPGQTPDDDDDDEGETKTSSGTNPSDAKDRSTRNKDRQKTSGETEETQFFDSSRIIRISPDRFAASFTMPDVRNNTLRFSLRTAGEQHQRNEERVRISKVIQTGDLLTQATIKDGDIIVQAPPQTHIALMISTEEPEERYSGYKLTLQEDGKETR